jgi:Fic family protein
MTWRLIPLPYAEDLETKSILKQLPAAHAALAELKGIIQSIPNQIILLNTLGIQEAKDSSSVENIITTHDDLYKANLDFEVNISPDVKEVQNYVAAMKRGFEIVQTQRMLTNQTILKIQETLEGNNAGFRKLPGTALKCPNGRNCLFTATRSYRNPKPDVQFGAVYQQCRNERL